MARRAKSGSKTTSTNPVLPSENVDPATAPLASSQEASTPVQATALNATKSNLRLGSTVENPGPVTTTPSEPDHAAALLTRVAEQQGKHKLTRRHWT